MCQEKSGGSKEKWLPVVGVGWGMWIHREGILESNIGVLWDKGEGISGRRTSMKARSCLMFWGTAGSLEPRMREGVAGDKIE